MDTSELPLESHPVMAALLEATARVSGELLAADLRLALREMDGQRPRIRSSGLEVPSVPCFGAEEGLAVLRATADELERSLFDGEALLRRLDWSTRIFRVAGRAFLAEGAVELSWRLYCEVGVIAMAPVLAHELVHLWLHRRRRPSDHTPEFLHKSLELGLPEMRHHLRIDSGGHRYRCPGCGRQVVRAARIRKTLACARCCDEHAGGRYDPRFRMVWIGRDEPRHRYYPEPALRNAAPRASGRKSAGRRPP